MAWSVRAVPVFSSMTSIESVDCFVSVRDVAVDAGVVAVQARCSDRDGWSTQDGHSPAAFDTPEYRVHNHNRDRFDVEWIWDEQDPWSGWIEWVSYLSPRRRFGSSRRARTDQALGFFFFVDDAASSNGPNRLLTSVCLSVSSSSMLNVFKNNRRGNSNKLWPEQRKHRFAAATMLKMLLRSRCSRSGVNMPMFVVITGSMLVSWSENRLVNYVFFDLIDEQRDAMYESCQCLTIGWIQWVVKRKRREREKCG